MITTISKCIACLKPLNKQNIQITGKEITDRVKYCSKQCFESRPRQQINHRQHYIDVLANQSNVQDTFRKYEIYYRRSH